MNGGGTSFILSIVATTLAVLSFCGSAWRLWRDRPRLIFYVGKANVHMPDNRIFQMLEIRACNVGFRPIIITRCVALGRNSIYSMGIHDEPAAAYGVAVQRFPSILAAGKTMTFHPISIDALARNMTDPKDPKVYYDPYKFLVLIDSTGRFHPMHMDDVLWYLTLKDRRERLNWRQKMLEYFHMKALFYRAKRKYLKND